MRPQGIVAAALSLAAVASAWPFGCHVARCASDVDCADGLVCHLPSELCIDPGAVAPTTSGLGAGGATTTSGLAGGGGESWPASCFNDTQDGVETDVDCGGADCPSCPAGAHCTFWWDCAEARCTQGYCCGMCTPCETCNAPGHEGACWPAPAGQDPNDDCLGVISCNGAGACCSAFQCSTGNWLDIDVSHVVFSSALTVEAWLYWNGPTGLESQWLIGLGAFDGDGTVTGWNLQIVSDSSLRFRWETPSGPCHVETTDVQGLLYQWRHVAAVYDDGQGRLFVGGRLVAEAACGSGGDLVNHDVMITVNWPPEAWANAIIDEVRLTDGVAYDGDFTPSTRLSYDASTIGLWHLDEARWASAYDATGNGHDGVLFHGGWHPQSVCDVVP